MELWGWLIGYVVLFALLHLVLYYVYVRRNDEGVQTSPFGDRNYSGSSSPSHVDRYPERSDDGRPDRPRPDIEGDAVRCAHCGVDNEPDQTFTYCWNCITPLHHR